MTSGSAPIERDYAAEMLAIVKAEMGGPFTAPELAAELVAKLRVTDPDLLIGFFGLERTMVNSLREYILTLNRSWRANDRRKARLAQQNETRERFERAVAEGDPAPLREVSATNFLGQRFVVNEDGLQVPYSKTGKPERLFIINDYAARERWEGLHKAYHMAVQRKAGNRITGDVFSEERLAKLYLSIVGNAA